MSSRDEKVAEVAAGVKHRVDSKLGDIWWAILIRGLLALGVAACALFWPQKTIGLLIKLLGVYFLIDGLAGIVGALRTQEKGSHLMQAIVSLVVGFVLLFWTAMSTQTFLIIVGVWALVQGANLFLASRGVDSEEERGPMKTTGTVLAVIGLILILWPNTGVVAVSWLIGLCAAVVGCLLIYLATRVKRVRSRIDDVGRPT